MKNATKIILGLAAGAVVAGGALYLIGRRQLATGPNAGDPATEGAKPDAVMSAGWSFVLGNLGLNQGTTGILTAPPGDPTADENTGTAGAVGEPIIGNRASAPTKAELATIGVFK